MALKTPASRLALLGGEIVRLAEMYRVVYEAHVAGRFGTGGDLQRWPRPEDLIRPRTATFKALSLQYLNAIRPNSATVFQITSYVQHCLKGERSKSACSQAMTELAAEHKVERLDHGRWKSTSKFGKKTEQLDKSALPEINAPGVCEQVRNMILTCGPIGVGQILDELQKHFSIGGKDAVTNIQTILGKSADIRHCTGLGYILLDLVHLEPSIWDRLRHRKQRVEGDNMRGMAMLGEALLDRLAWPARSSEE